MELRRIVRLVLMALFVCVLSTSVHAGVIISVGFAPPPLPVYEQPVCPEPGLMWTPGYWAYGDAGYYWVPGTWVPAPSLGLLWTPHYWGWEGGRYIFHEGYWGPHVGYYGGINYGFGYGGIGFAGGEWRGGVFAYNSAVMHVGVGGGWGSRVYVDHEVVVRNTVANPGHVGFNGGPGGIHHDPTPGERSAGHEPHQGPSTAQQQHQSGAASNPASLAKNNGGHPTNGAVGQPLGGHGGTTGSHGAPTGTPGATTAGGSKSGGTGATPGGTTAGGSKGGSSSPVVGHPPVVSKPINTGGGTTGGSTGGSKGGSTSHVVGRPINPAGGTAGGSSPRGTTPLSTGHVTSGGLATKGGASSTTHPTGTPRTSTPRPMTTAGGTNTGSRMVTNSRPVVSRPATVPRSQGSPSGSAPQPHSNPSGHHK